MKQVAVFYLLAFSISWLIWLPLYGKTFGVDTGAEIPFNHALGGLGPLLASIITTWIFNGKSEVKRLLRSCFSFSSAIYFLIALLVPFLLLLVAIFGDAYVNGTAMDFSGVLRSKEFPTFTYFSFFFYNLLFFGFGEEAGWRGFALPRIQSRWNALIATLILTVFWALWHLPLFYYRPGYMEMGLGGIVGWIFSLLTGSILLTWLYNSSRGSILICAVFHTTIDLVFTADVNGKDTVQFLGVMITLWGLVILLAYKAKNLSATERITLRKQ